MVELFLQCQGNSSTVGEMASKGLSGNRFAATTVTHAITEVRALVFRRHRECFESQKEIKESCSRSRKQDAPHQPGTEATKLGRCSIPIRADSD